MMVEYGMKPAAVLKSATSVNADVFGYADKIGRIKKDYLQILLPSKAILPLIFMTSATIFSS
jgi:hypothetical protein